MNTVRRWIGRVLGIIFGILLAWLMAEILIRATFFALPIRLQQTLRNTHLTPFSDTTILPAPVWVADGQFLNVNREVSDYPLYGSPDVKINVTTERLWDTHLAFRTTQAQVNRYVDAVAIGDSFTFCFTELQDCWVTQLAALTDKNIINLGITGTGSVSHQRVLAGFGAPLTPPLIIWQWFGNDANEDYGLAILNGETDIPSPAAPVANAPNWWGKHSAMYVVLDTLTKSEAALEPFLWNVPQDCTDDLCFGAPYFWGAFDATLANNQYGWERSLEAFRQAQATVESFEGTLLIILMPAKEQVYREIAEPLVGAENMAKLDSAHAQMLEVCEQENLTCLDLLPILGAHNDETLYYRLDLHINPRGNEVVAEAIAAWLAEH